MKKIHAIFIAMLLLASCAESKEKFVVGISLQTNNRWGETVREEALRQASFYPQDIEVVIKSVERDSYKQIKDIEEFLNAGVDLLIVSPNDREALNSVITKAYRSGIPVVIMNNRPTTRAYNVYVGPDITSIGGRLGAYISTMLYRKANAVVMRGDGLSVMDRELYEGFTRSISRYPDVKIVAEEYGEYSRERAREKMISVIEEVGYENIDFVFAMTDDMAIGVSEACRMYDTIRRPYIIGIGAMFGEGGGIEAIDAGIIDASFRYPTGGEAAVEIAHRILHGMPCYQENLIDTRVIDESNIATVQVQERQKISQHVRLDEINDLTASSIIRYTEQKQSFYAVLAMVLISLVALGILLKTLKSKSRLNRQLNVKNDQISKQVDTLETQKEQLIGLSEKLEAATQEKLSFFTDISHEFKTPLTLISGPVDEMLRSNSISPKDKETLTLVQRNSYRLMGLLSQILEFRSFEQGKINLNYSVDRLDEFIERINQLFSKFVTQKRIRFSFETDGSDFNVPFDKEKFEKIYFNILSNAFKHVKSNGAITVTLSRGEENGEYYRLSVHNTGSFIPHDELDNIFTRFYHLDNRQESSGIGLALTKSLVDTHGGSISAESDETGTTFTVCLPIVAAPDAESRRTKAASDVSRHLKNQISSLNMVNRTDDILIDSETNDKPVVLLIEDDADMRYYIRGILSRDYFVVEAKDGDEGIKKAFKYMPALIVTDIMMPGTDGFEVCLTLKSNPATSNIPIVVLTACGMDEQKIEGFEKGADAYILKPFNSEILRIRAQKLIENFQSLNKTMSHEWLVGDSHNALSEGHKKLITNLKQYVEEHMQDEISVDDLSAHLGISRSMFYRKLKETTDYSPTELINRIKLRKAANMMLYERKTVSEVAFETGFSSSSYFAKIFTKYYQQRPSEFIKQYIQDPSELN